MVQYIVNTPVPYNEGMTTQTKIWIIGPIVALIATIAIVTLIIFIYKKYRVPTNLEIDKSISDLISTYENMKTLRKTEFPILSSEGKKYNNSRDRSFTT